MGKKQYQKKAAEQSPQTRALSSTHKWHFSLEMKLAILLGLFSFMVYANSIKNGFVLDDGSAITDNTIVTKGVTAIPEILSTPYRKGVFEIPNDLYRPLSLVMFAVEYQLFGLNPMPGHLINVLLFAACVILLFQVLNKLSGKNGTATAFIAAMLFAVHPIHTEVVANIKSRDELLCFFFAFLSLAVFMRYMLYGKARYLILASLCFFLSLLSKESVITFVAIIPLIFFFINNENKKRSIYITISAAIVALLFLTIRFSVLTAYHANDMSIINFVDNALAKGDLSFESRIATAILIMGNYLKLLFVPYPLICDYSYDSIPFVHFSDPWVLVSLAIYVSIVIVGIKRFSKNQKDPFAFGILFFLITISLFSNIFFLIGTTMGERLLFFPSAGFCLLMALLIQRLSIKANGDFLQVIRNSKILAIIIPVCIVYGIITMNRNSDWLDGYTLYGADIKKVPNNSKLNCLMGSEIEKKIAREKNPPEREKQLFGEAITYLSKSVSIYPDFSDAQYNLGFAYFSTGQIDSAEIHDKRAIEILPINLNAISNLAKIYFMKQKYAPSADYYKRAIKLNAQDVAQYTNVGVCYFYLGRYDSSIYYSNKAIAMDPTLKASYEILAFCYKAIGNPDSTGKYEAIAKKNNLQFKL